MASITHTYLHNFVILNLSETGVIYSVHHWKCYKAVTLFSTILFSDHLYKTFRQAFLNNLQKLWHESKFYFITLPVEKRISSSSQS